MGALESLIAELEEKGQLEQRKMNVEKKDFKRLLLLAQVPMLQDFLYKLMQSWSFEDYINDCATSLMTVAITEASRKPHQTIPTLIYAKPNMGMTRERVVSRVKFLSRP